MKHWCYTVVISGFIKAKTEKNVVFYHAQPSNMRHWRALDSTEIHK